MSYPQPAFYHAFLRDPLEAPAQAVAPYENVNLKLFAAMENPGRDHDPAAGRRLDRAEYAGLFPDEAKRVYELFIETTWGGTASQEVATAMRRAAIDGHRGDIALFRQDRPFPLLDELIAEIAGGKRTLDANLGPELWMANTGFKIAPAVWDTNRMLPLTINLNTASVAELMTLPGVDLAMARRIIAARDQRGFFRSIDELSEARVPGGVIASLQEIQKVMDQVGRYDRPWSAGSRRPLIGPCRPEGIPLPRRHSPAGRTGRSHVVQQLIDRLLAGPRDAPEQGPLNLAIGEIGVGVALHPHEGPGRLAAGECVFVGPDLRHDFALVVAGAARRGDLRVGQHVDGGIFGPGHQ